MAGYLLTLSSTILCPHGAQVICSPRESELLAAGAPVLFMDDTFVVAGCPNAMEGRAVPCVTVRWLTGSQLVTRDGAGALLHTSDGLCLSGEGLALGAALIVSYQQIEQDEDTAQP